MGIRTAHGRAARQGRLLVVETLPATELPAGTPAPARPVATRDASGRLVRGAGTTELARHAARARAEARQLARLLGLWEPPEGHPFAAYARLAREWRDAHMAQLSATVAGGEVGPGPASIVATAALQLGASRYLTDLGARNGDAKALVDGSRLGDASRQSLLTAHELAAREAEARKRSRPYDPSARPWAPALPEAEDSGDEGEPTAGSSPESDAVNGQPDGTEGKC